jgi:hypothetical protein
LLLTLNLACTAYSRYILDVGQSEDWLALQMALAPCLIGYGAIAKRLHTEKETLREGNRYWQWIENYVAEDYTEAVRLGSGKDMILFFATYLSIHGSHECSRTTGDTHTTGLTKSDGGTDQDLHPGNGIGNQLLGYGIG